MMINLKAAQTRYGTLETYETTHTAAETRMSDNQRMVAEALDAQGYLALWADGKGGGFWIKGTGYQSLRQSAKLVNVKLTRKAKKIA
jgi:hypothetical protein